MKKLNNRGIAISSILYTLLVLLLALIFGALGLTLSGKSTFETLKNDVINKLNNVEANREKTILSYTNSLLFRSNTYSYMGGTYLKGIQENNYVWYSGNLYRIMGKDADQNIRLISEVNITGIPYSTTNVFESSYANNWLNEYFYSHLNDQSILENTAYCLDATDDLLSARTTCTNKGSDTKVALISLDEYRLALQSTTMSCNEVGTRLYHILNNANEENFQTFLTGNNISCIEYAKYAVDYYSTTGLTATFHEDSDTIDFVVSYLDDLYADIFWTITPSSNNGLWRVSSTLGSTVDLVASSFGLRPVITISSNIKITSGDGTIDSPIIIGSEKEKTGKLIDNATSGEYVTLEGKRYRVVEKISDTGTRLILDEYLDSLDTYTNMMAKMMDNTYLSSLGLSTSDSRLVNYTWTIGNYFGWGANYQLAFVSSGTTFTSYTGGIKIGEMYSSQSNAMVIEDKEWFWTMTPYTSSQAYVIGAFSYAYSAYYTSNSRIRPSIVISKDVVISAGDGTLENPYEI